MAEDKVNPFGHTATGVGTTPTWSQIVGGQITQAPVGTAGANVGTNPTYGQMLAANEYNASLGRAAQTASEMSAADLASKTQATRIAGAQDTRAAQAQAWQQQMAQQAAAAEAAKWAQTFAEQQRLTNYKMGGSDIVREQNKALFGTLHPAIQALLPTIQGGVEQAMKYLTSMGENLGEYGYQSPGMSDIVSKILQPLERQQSRERQEFENRISGAGRQVESAVFQPARSEMEAGQQATLNAESMKALFAQRGMDLQTMQTVLAGIPQITGAAAPLMQMLTQLYGDRAGMGTL